MKINLKGPDGNAFAIMAMVRQYLRVIGQADKVQSYFDEAKSSDYPNLLEVSQKYCPALEFENGGESENRDLR